MRTTISRRLCPNQQEIMFNQQEVMLIIRRLCESLGGYVNQQEVMWISRRLCESAGGYVTISRRLCDTSAGGYVKTNWKACCRPAPLGSGKKYLHFSRKITNWKFSGLQDLCLNLILDKSKIEAYSLRFKLRKLSSKLCISVAQFKIVHKRRKQSMTKFSFGIMMVENNK